jgi:cysteine desulfurase
MKRIYLDNNATTPLKEEVRAAMARDFPVYGNASSMHASGREARARVEEARGKVAALLGVPAKTALFTSGGTEANNTVFSTMRIAASGKDGAPLTSGRRVFITTSIEHPCVLNSAKYLKSLGYKVIFLPVDEHGRVDMDAYKKALNEETLFVSVMTANNEIGTIQDIREIASMAKAAGAFMHTDAVQAVGKIPVNAAEWGVDYLTVSAHKIYGPKGIGALYVKEKAPLFPLLHGGHQEDGMRAGTYNNGGILGFGKAAELATADIAVYNGKVKALRDKLMRGFLEKIPSIRINGHETENLPNTLNASFPGAEGEAILLSLDLAGIEVSTGSACASGSLEPSHVLLATGVEAELAHGSIRFSLGLETGDDDIEYVLETMPKIIARLRSFSTIKIR